MANLVQATEGYNDSKKLFKKTSEVWQDVSGLMHDTQITMHYLALSNGYIIVIGAIEDGMSCTVPMPSDFTGLKISANMPHPRAVGARVAADNTLRFYASGAVTSIILEYTVN